MITLTGFDRRLTVGDQTRDVTLEPAEIRWLDAQTHSGENIGSTPTRVFFVELKATPEHGQGRRCCDHPTRAIRCP